MHYRDWQVSETVQLEAGAAYFLRATHRSEGGVECCTHHLSVGVRVPSGAPMPDSVPEVQVLEVDGSQHTARLLLRNEVHLWSGNVRAFMCQHDGCGMLWQSVLGS